MYIDRCTVYVIDVHDADLGNFSTYMILSNTAINDSILFMKYFFSSIFQTLTPVNGQIIDYKIEFCSKLVKLKSKHYLSLYLCIQMETNIVSSYFAKETMKLFIFKSILMTSKMLNF